MAIIRALAFHAPKHRGGLTEKYLDDLLGFSSCFRELGDSFKTKIWTRRIVLPRTGDVEGFDLYDLSVKADEITRRFVADFVALPLGNVDVDKIGPQITSALSHTSTTFFSINAEALGDALLDSKPMPLVRLLKQITESAGPEACSRFAIAFGNQPETPYFPDTASERKGFSISSRYVPEVDEGLVSLGFEGAERSIGAILLALEREARTASASSGLRYLGLDPSISPWMDESIALVISRLMGNEFGNVGTYYAVHALNSAIMKASRSVTTLGFKEIMLPVAEDDELKRLASTRKIDIKLLVSLISVCVAGLDMVVLPLSTPDKKLADLLLDVFSIAQRRNKALGIRLILADAKPGEWIQLGRFGSVPVMQI